MKRLSLLLLGFVLLTGCTFSTPANRTQIPPPATLDSWSRGPVKQRIISFVNSVSDPASPLYVPAQDRLAVFDMDGTLLCEKPDYIEVAITQNRLREKAAADPTLAENPLYKAALTNDNAYINQHVKEAILEAFANEYLSDMAAYWRQYITRARHPSLKLEYSKLFYKPMIELIEYLQAAEFAVFVVSTSQQEFIRSLCPDFLPVPKQNVIGTMVAFTLANLDDDAPHLFRRQKAYFEPYNADDKKSVRIRERGIEHALLAAGNSMGDYAMLDGVSDSGRTSLVIVVDHDDSAREFEYHKPDLLEIARKRGWVVTSMKHDFLRIF